MDRRVEADGLEMSFLVGRDGEHVPDARGLVCLGTILERLASGLDRVRVEDGARGPAGFVWELAGLGARTTQG